MSTSLRKSTAAVSCPWTTSAAKGQPVTLEEMPGVLLTRLAQSIHQEISAAYARPHGLSPTEWRLLARLNAQGSMLLRDLCTALAMDKAYASRILRALQPRGLLAVQGDPQHGRRLIVSITPAGQALARELLPQAREAQMQLLDVLDASERVVLYAALRKLQAAVDARALVSRAARGADATLIDGSTE